MLPDDSAALSFEIPARDALGQEHVEGKLVAAGEALRFYWRLRGRTFRKPGVDMELIALDYADVESVSLKTTLYLFRPRLVLRLTDPRPLGGVPGTQVGAAILMLPARGARLEARAFLKLLDYRKSEAMARERIDRLSDLDRPSGQSVL